MHAPIRDYFRPTLPAPSMREMPQPPTESLNPDAADIHVKSKLVRARQVRPSRKSTYSRAPSFSPWNALSSITSALYVVKSVHRVQHIDPSAIVSIADLARSFEDVGVLGAGRLGRAVSIVRQMFEDSNCLTYLALSGPMVPGGLRHIISHLIRVGHIDVIVSSGANIVHDLIEAYGGFHSRVPAGASDSELRHGGMGRIADIFVHDKHFETLERRVYDLLDSLSPEERTSLAPSEFLSRIGRTLDDDRSILRQAAINNVPIFSPGLLDSMLGFHLFTYSTTSPVSLDFVKDLRILARIVNEAQRTGAIMLGGGLTKHFTMGSTILRGGLDLAVQVTLDRPEGGSLGGAPLVEGVSWQKMQEESRFETVIGDATIVFPIIVIGALQSME